MHQLIRIIVPGTDQRDALTRATQALDTLAGIGFATPQVFDSYKTLDDSAARFSSVVASMIADDRDGSDEPNPEPAYSVPSNAGQELLNDGLERQPQQFLRVFDRFQAKYDDGLTPMAVMNDVNGARFNLRQLGEYEGPMVYLYDEHGNGLQSPTRVSNYLERVHDGDASYAVTSDGTPVELVDEDATASSEEPDTGAGPWIVLADVHY